MNDCSKTIEQLIGLKIATDDLPLMENNYRISLNRDCFIFTKTIASVDMKHRDNEVISK